MTVYGERKCGVKCINYVSPSKLDTWRRILSNEIYTKVKIGKCLSCEFKVNKGFTQVYSIAPLLLNAVLGVAIRRSTVETQGTIFEKM